MCATIARFLMSSGLYFEALVVDANLRPVGPVDFLLKTRTYFLLMMSPRFSF